MLKSLLMIQDLAEQILDEIATAKVLLAGEQAARMFNNINTICEKGGSSNDLQNDGPAT